MFVYLTVYSYNSFGTNDTEVLNFFDKPAASGGLLSSTKRSAKLEHILVSFIVPDGSKKLVHNVTALVCLVLFIANAFVHIPLKRCAFCSEPKVMFLCMCSLYNAKFAPITPPRMFPSVLCLDEGWALGVPLPSLRGPECRGPMPVLITLLQGCDSSGFVFG